MKPDEVSAAYRRHWPSTIGRGLEALSLGSAVSAQGATVTMSDGRKLVDLASGGFGYSHPKVVARVAEQVKKMPLSSRVFFSVPLARLLERIAAITPGELAVSFFGNAGAEALEGALKLARGYHGDRRRRVVAAVNGYHGATTGALAVCGIEELRRAVSPRRQPVAADFVPYGDADALRRAVDERTNAVVLESVQAGAGVVVPPAGYLRAVREHCDKTGALLILDEVVTGLGVTGKMFAADHDGVTPDIMVLAGALGGGVMAIGGYVAKEPINTRVYDKQDPLLHANTTGGNPTACTAALTAIEVVEEEGLVARAEKAGSVLGKELASLASRHAESVTGAASRGLLGSLSFRDANVARAVQRAAAAAGAIVRLDGGTGARPVLSVRAPLLTSEGELERGLRALATALDQIGARPAASAEAAG